MVSAYVFITTQVGKVKKVIEEVKKIEGVEEAKAVTGSFDIVAKLSARDLGTLTKAIIEKIHEIDGVLDTQTAIIVEL